MMEHNQVTIRTYMVIRAERDAAIQERNMALNERKRAFAERDMAMLQRDAAIAERDSALQERDEAITSLQLRQGSMKDNYLNPGPPGNIMVHEVKHIPDQYEMGLATYISEAASGAREFPTSNPCQSHVAFEMKRSKNIKQKQEIDGVSLQLTKSSRMSGKSIGDLSKQASNSSSGGQKNEQNLVSDDEDVDGSWKDNLELNHIIFDESSMPVPVCSCTGLPQPCYKWGNGGWQSACCTTTISMYPLPHTSSKRHSRVAGRKMSGGVFTKLLNRLVAEGHDLSTSLDLKDHWGKHGTNGYVTQK